MDEATREFIGEGVYSAVLLGLLVGAAKWAATNLFIPMRDGHLNYLKVSMESQKKQGETLETVSGCLTELKNQQSEHMLICKGQVTFHQEPKR